MEAAGTLLALPATGEDTGGCSHACVGTIDPDAAWFRHWVLAMHRRAQTIMRFSVASPVDGKSRLGRRLSSLLHSALDAVGQTQRTSSDTVNAGHLHAVRMIDTLLLFYAESNYVLDLAPPLLPSWSTTSFSDCTVLAWVEILSLIAYRYGGILKRNMFGAPW